MQRNFEYFYVRHIHQAIIEVQCIYENNISLLKKEIVNNI